MNKEISLNELDSKERYDRVTVSAKVLIVSQKVLLPEGLCKQDVHIGDSTAYEKIVLFENDIDTLEKGKTYKFENVMVNEFQKEKYRQIPRTGSKLTEIENLEVVVVEDAVPDTPTIPSAEVVGVLSMNTFISCINCKSKITKTSDTMGQCTKCSMKQSLRHSTKQLRAKIVLTTPGGEYITLNALADCTEVSRQVDQCEAIHIDTQYWCYCLCHKAINNLSTIDLIINKSSTSLLQLSNSLFDFLLLYTYLSTIVFP